MDVAPAQIVSVATALIPFLEHNDANRALMGANMQRQAVPLMIPQAPLVGTGLEYRAAIDTGDVVVSQTRRHRDRRRRRKIVVEAQGRPRGVRADEVHALEPGHADPPEAGRRRSATRSGRSRCSRTAASTDGGELALGANLLVAFMPFEGYNFEDAIVSQRAARQGRRAQLDPHPRVRDRRPLDEARRRGDHPRHSEPLGGVAREPRRPRRRPHRRRGRLRRPARRQGDAEGRDRADGRGEADPRDLQGEGARGPRHVAQGPARRGRQGDRRQDVLPRRGRRPVAGRERARPRLRGEEAQDLGGRQARRPPRQQGRHLEDRPRGGHAVPRGRPPGRRRARTRSACRAG